MADPARSRSPSRSARRSARRRQPRQTASPLAPEHNGRMAFQVAVCGPSDCTAEEYAAAYEVGVLLAQRGNTVVCGGGPGVMAAVAAGVRAANGIVIGVLPGGDRSAVHAELTAAIATNMGEARNAVIIASVDAVIAIG